MKLWHAFYITAKEKAEESIEQREERIESSMDTEQERRKHWYALSSTNLWIGFTWYWISKFTSFLKKPDLLLVAIETLTHHVSMQIIMFVKQKKIIGDSTDSF